MINNGFYLEIFNTVIVFVRFDVVKTNETIQWLPFFSSFLPESFVVIPVSLDVLPPEMLELLGHFSWSDLLQSEDEDPGDDDTEDIEEGEGQTDQAEQEGLE